MRHSAFFKERVDGVAVTTRTQMQERAQAVIWHEAALFSPGGDASGLRAALSAFHDAGVAMAVVTDGDPGALRGMLLRQNISPYFDKNPAKVAVFSTADHETTVHDHALTAAFARARDALGTDRRATLAAAENCEQVRRARYAGLPVVGYTNSPRETRDRMIDHGAFFAAAAAIDLADAVLQFRPFKEAKWYPVASPGSGR